MATKQKRGWKSYLPTMRGVVQIFVGLVAIKFLIGVVGGVIGASIPADVAKRIPIL